MRCFEEDAAIADADDSSKKQTGKIKHIGC